MTFNSSVTRKVVFSILVVVCFLAANELALRLSGFDTYVQNRFFVVNRALDYPDVFLRDKQLFWRLKKDQTVTSNFFEGRTYRINSFGLRGKEISKEKNKPRIVTLGNSCTFGWRIDSNLTYTAKLEKLLEHKYEIINAGIPGYSSYQGKSFFETELVKLKPDYVLILFGWNDHWAAANGIADKDQQLPSKLIINIQNQLSNLHLYRVIKKVVLSSIESDIDSLFDREAPVYRVAVNDFEHNLRSICRTARDNLTVPILITAPIPSLQNYYPPGINSGLHRYHELYNQAVRQVAEQDSVLLVDAALEFDKFGNLYDDARDDPIHFNVKGHELLADLLRASFATFD